MCVMYYRVLVTASAMDQETSTLASSGPPLRNLSKKYRKKTLAEKRQMRQVRLKKKHVEKQKSVEKQEWEMQVEVMKYK